MDWTSNQVAQYFSPNSIKRLIRNSMLFFPARIFQGGGGGGKNNNQNFQLQENKAVGAPLPVEKAVPLQLSQYFSENRLPTFF